MAKAVPQPAKRLPPNVPTLLERARAALQVHKSALGSALGVSPQTMYRWVRGESRPGPAAFRQLAVRIHPADPTLAAELAAAGGATPAALGLVTRPKVPLEPLAAESVVSAAADALSLPPKAVRPAVLAALERAQALGATVESLLTALRV